MVTMPSALEVNVDPPADEATRRDITTRTDVHDLVVAFYREIVFDDVLCPLFEEVAEVDWAAHIPRLIDYWCRHLLNEPVYTGSLFTAHRLVHERSAFRAEHFDRWYRLWVDTIDSRWRGPNADLAKSFAATMAGHLSTHLRHVDWAPQQISRPR